MTTLPMVSFGLVLALCGGSLTASAGGWDGGVAPAAGSVRSQPQTVELAALARSWSSDWTVIGTKTEPTYIEKVRISRRGDRFTLDADISGERLGRIEMSVDGHGRVAVLACPRALSCDVRPAGFLATVQFLAAARRGELGGSAPVLRYAGREVACVPVDLLRGNADAGGGSTVGLRAVVDPCFDTLTGAVFAQRSRDDGSFSGPTLDEGTLIVLDRTTGASQPFPADGSRVAPR